MGDIRIPGTEDSYIYTIHTGPGVHPRNAHGPYLRTVGTGNRFKSPHIASRTVSFVLLQSQQMSSSLQLPLDSSSSDRVTCPAQLSDESFAKFVIELPLLDESRLSPALVACAAKLRAQFVDALSNAQTVLHAMRDAWIAWHHLPIASPGIVLCCFVRRVAQTLRQLVHLLLSLRR